MSRKHLILLIHLSWSSFSLFSKSGVLQFGARLVTLPTEPTVSFSFEMLCSILRKTELKFFLAIKPDSSIKPDV
ncbi:unnamed protein product [Porites lobata]|uniref:Secreted protein n=1 Tax=Porites lobata TaxID=104759 RepID=A0ABN8MTS2_9CNID|nr:unnamed protein product [Porites lobata]